MNEQELTRIFIGPCADSYLKKWQENKYSFCWPALFFGVFWMLYRKMYLFAFYVFLIGIMYVIVAYLIGIPEQYFSVITLLMPIGIAIFGKQLYRRHVNDKVQSYKKNPKYDLEIFRLYGGVTWSVPIMWLVLQMVAMSFIVLPIIHKLYFSDSDPKEIYRIELELH